MKQNITPDQLKELSPEAKERLNKWWDNNYAGQVIPNGMAADQGSEENANWDAIYVKYGDPLLSIGQMIELIWNQTKHELLGDIPMIKLGDDNGWQNAEKLCDDLWEEVKEVLSSGDKP